MTTAQRILLIGSLGVGYFLYRNALREVIYQNQNTFLNSELISQLKAQNFTVVGQNRVLIGNPINKSYDSSRERIVILGGGLAGLGTAYYLAKLKKYDVILLEKNDNFLQIASGAHGGVICPSQCYPQTNASFLFNGIRSFFSNDTPVKFSYRAFFERNITIWLANYFLNLSESSQVRDSKKLAHLAKLSMEEISILNQEIEFNEICNMTSKGTLQLYSTKKSKESNKSKIEAIKASGVSIRELDQDQLVQLEPALADSLVKYECGYVGPMDTNVNMNNFGEKLAQICEINGVTLFPGAEFHRFLFQKETNQMIGVITSQGIILCDKVVIASGIRSKDMAYKLGVRLPLLSLKQYSVTANMPENKTLMHNLVDDRTRTFLSPLNRKYLITGHGDLGFDVENIQDDRIQYLVNGAKAKIGEFNSENIDVWANLRTLSSDDVPIIGPLPKYENIYINAGHGTKAVTLALGSGKVVADIIDGRHKHELELDYSLSRFYLV